MIGRWRTLFLNCIQGFFLERLFHFPLSLLFDWIVNFIYSYSIQQQKLLFWTLRLPQQKSLLVGTQEVGVYLRRRGKKRRKGQKNINSLKTFLGWPGGGRSHKKSNFFI